MSNERSDEGLIQHLRAVIRSRLAEQRPVSLHALAKTLALGARTLQRRLQAQGTHFARILREERQTTDRLLTLEGHRREAMARALGYCSTRSVDRIRNHARADRRPARASAVQLPASLH